MKDQKNEKKIVTVETKREKNGEVDNKEWKKPTFEDVSGRVMAQPYIRFT